jgi:hypothetical protein
LGPRLLTKVGPPSFVMLHIHHIIPKHAGGSDEPENLIELTIEQHAEAHRLLFDEFGRWQDYVAWKSLAGKIGKEERLHIIASNIGKVSGKKTGAANGRKSAAKTSATRIKLGLGKESAKYVKPHYGSDNPMKNPEIVAEYKKRITGRKRRYLPDGSWEWHYPNR